MTSNTQSEPEEKIAAKQYRKKPIVVEAFQWKSNCKIYGDTPGEWADLDAWLVSLGYPSYEEADGSGKDVTMWMNGDDSITIPTLEGDMRCDIGDWIIRGVKGEFYPCKPDVFALTYEPADSIPSQISEAVKAEREKWNAVRNAGARLSNIAYNLSQRATALTERYRQTMRDCCDLWDAAIRARGEAK